MWFWREDAGILLFPNKLESQTAYLYPLFLLLPLSIWNQTLNVMQHSDHAAWQLLSGVHSILISILEIMLNAWKLGQMV